MTASVNRGIIDAGGGKAMNINKSDDENILTLPDFEIGYIDYNGESLKAELHWYQEPTVGKVKFIIKRWIE